METTMARSADEPAPGTKVEHNADEDCFFESLDRVSSSVSFFADLASSSSDSDVDDPRISFASAVGTFPDFRNFSFAHSPSSSSFNHVRSPSASSSSLSSSSSIDRSPDEDYGVWMAEPLSIEERRRRLLHGMGLASSKELAVSGRRSAPAPAASTDPPLTSASDLPSVSLIVRSKSDAGPESESARVWRLVHLLGTPSPPRSLARASSMPISFSLSPPRASDYEGLRTSNGVSRNISDEGDIMPSGEAKFCTIKDLDTGKEFVIDELVEAGSGNRLSDPQTGLRLTIDEFEKTLGYSPIVKELMRRANIGSGGAGSGGNKSSAYRPLSQGSLNLVKSRGMKKGIGWLKNIRGVANSVTTRMQEKEREVDSSASAHCASSTAASSSERTKVRQRRKPYKELTGLYLCQEIQAHEGSIWTIKFSPDEQLLASAGVDRVIHVWQVLDTGAGAAYFRQSQEEFRAPSDLVSCSSGRSTLTASPFESGRLDVRPSDRRKSRKILSGKKTGSIPHHIVPGAVFSLSKDPFCSFRGHLDDVLDLSWSKSQHLLSSSMDKTVRLWDMESKACLKLFAHNDYVTCIQFNPIDDRYFISGSLDAKVRIWNIPDRQVVDWEDLHEMVTAIRYTPDGQGAIVGSHKGNCRLYSTSNGKLHQKTHMEIQNKKRKSSAKKITGFQFVPGNSSEVLITSADSRIRVFNGADLIHKFTGFRNTSSQISASFTADGNYVVCASEDSHVYVWKREETRGASGKGKTWITTRSYERFHCKDVSVAIPWPPSNSSKCESPLLSSYLSQENCQLPQGSPDSEQPQSSMTILTGDAFTSCRSYFPPLPKKSYSDQSPVHEDELSNASSLGSGISSSTSNSASHWLMSGALSSISALNTLASTSSSLRWYNGGSRSSNVPASTAWGLVVVTAGLGGEIKIYQNFGVPRLLSRQHHMI